MNNFADVASLTQQKTKKSFHNLIKINMKLTPKNQKKLMYKIYYVCANSLEFGYTNTNFSTAKECGFFEIYPVTTYYCENKRISEMSSRHEIMIPFSSVQSLEKTTAQRNREFRELKNK